MIPVARSHSPLISRRAGAFSIIEASVSVLIVGVLLAAAMNALGTAQRTGSRAAQTRTGESLAHQLMAEILAQPYRGADDDEDTFGPSTAELAAGDRTLFNDLNDYLDWSEKPPKEKDGTAISGVSTWTRAAVVEFLDPANILDKDPSNDTDNDSDTGIARITVTVSADGRQVQRLTTVRAFGSDPGSLEACCMDDGTCVMLTADACDDAGGTSQGLGSNCWNTDCAGGTLPMAHFPFDENAGTTTEDINEMHTGTLEKGVAWATGKLGTSSVSFDGKDDQIRVPHDPLLECEHSVTVAAWIYKQNNTYYQAIVAKGTTNVTWNYYFATYYGDLVFGTLSGGSFDEQYTTGLKLKTKQWYHVVATFDAVTKGLKFYVDGKLIRSTSLAATLPANSEALLIGNDSLNERFNGRIDDLRIYDVVLDDTQIKRIMDGKEP